MNKIVRAHYPVELLPNDLRELAGSARTVTVTIETEGSHPVPQSAAEMLAEMKEARDSLSVSPEDDPVGRIRKLRDEWED
jgi:hypothetical protein